MLISLNQGESSGMGEASRFCPNCGRASSLAFCPYCGASMQHYQTAQPQLLAQRPSHAGRNLGILLLLAILFFVVPIVNVESVSIPYGFGSVNVNLTGSLSYSILHCGEVHLTGSGSVLGSNVASIDRYEWLCGNQPPSP